MSSSKNISRWMDRSKIDYIPLFISLWLALNAWMKARFKGKTDRDFLNLLKSSDVNLKDRFAAFMHQEDAKSCSFRGNLAELCRALDNAGICYTKYNLRDRKISFSNCIIDWDNDSPEFRSILKEENQREKIKIDDNLWVEDNNNLLFPAYIEILYQVRCALFHGDLPPNKENERVIKQLYLTLSMIMSKD